MKSLLVLTVLFQSMVGIAWAEDTQAERDAKLDGAWLECEKHLVETLPDGRLRFDQGYTECQSIAVAKQAKDAGAAH